MGHQPFENWILDDQALTAEQNRELADHLVTCPECQKLQNSLAAATTLLKTAPTARPTAGFTDRWRVLQAERRALQHKRQTRIFFLSTILGALVALGGLVIALSLSNISFSDLFVSGAKLIAGLLNVAGDARFYLGTSLTGPLPIVIWILVSVGFCLLVFAWVYMLWRISSQGVHHNEKSI
jgi:hypothetical protein